jgi:hypothetical protein
MNKTLIALATALVAAATILPTTAEAGFKVRLGFGFPIGGFTAHSGGGGDYEYKRHKRREVVRRRAKEKVHVAKKPVRVEKVIAKADPEPVTEAVQSENSSIATTPATAAATAEEKATETKVEAPAKSAEAEIEPNPAADAKTAGKLDCKKFFPSVGLTLSVPCE